MPLAVVRASESGHGILPERAYQQLRHRIISGRVVPGERIIESQIALQLGVSRTPIREALAQLTRDGFLVAVTSGRRTELAVAPLDSASVLELWGIVGALEGQAARVAAARPESERADLAEDLRRLNANLMRYGQRRPRDPDGLVEGQAEFHDRYVKPYGGARLLALYDTVRPHVQRYEWAFGQHYDAELNESTGEHEQIISAILLGDPRAAREAVEAHWTQAAVRTATVIERLAQRQRRGAQS